MASNSISSKFERKVFYRKIVGLADHKFKFSDQQRSSSSFSSEVRKQRNTNDASLERY